MRAAARKTTQCLRITTRVIALTTARQGRTAIKYTLLDLCSRVCFHLFFIFDI